ncbi:hypothetical protein ABFS83_07G016400 [Erythranthe nasuta]
MVLPRKCTSVNNRCSSIPKLSLTKDGDGAQRSKSRRRMLADKLGPKWTVKELTRYYNSYYKNGKDWEKVADAVRNRSLEMVEALYTMNRAYLSLPRVATSAAALISMMADHYRNSA